MFKIVLSVLLKDPFVLGQTKAVQSSEQRHRILQAGTSRGTRDLVAERNVGVTEMDSVSIQTDTQREDQRWINLGFSLRLWSMKETQTSCRKERTSDTDSHSVWPRGTWLFLKVDWTTSSSSIRKKQLQRATKVHNVWATILKFPKLWKPEVYKFGENSVSDKTRHEFTWSPVIIFIHPI